MYIYSTISTDVDYQITGTTFRVTGKANVANQKIITPLGVATKATAEEVAELKKNHVFQLHLENGFLSISDHKEDAEKVAADMQARDKSAPDTEGDMLLDSEVEEVKGVTIKKKQQ